ncbi:glycosyltransferase [Segatella buccae]|uniref:glycosyltransferase n=1 Tax=Segatella buccae TaxID=28126 RepID=UPI000E0F4920|nr:glycosyltransferase [Segatella buccae]
MRVLQLGKFYPILGGVEKVMFDLVRGLSQQGVDCDMLCANGEIGESSYIVKLNEKAKIYCERRLLKICATVICPSMVLRLRHMCKYYDIIHIHHPDPMAALALIFSGYKGKVILHWHSDILKQRLLLKFFLPLQNWLVNRADVIIGTTPVYVACSPYLTQVQTKCTYLPIGIDPLQWDDKKVEKIRNDYKGKKIIFSLGRLVHYKGFEYLIDAAKYIDDDNIILIGGGGELQKKLQKKISACGLQDKVVLLGRIPNECVSSYFKACDLYCLSSIQKTEAFAIVQIEAMSCGKPIVATEILGSGVSWVNADGVSGINVKPKSGYALSKAINRILKDESLYEKLSMGASFRFKTIFQKQAMIEKCMDIYRLCFS